MPKLVLQNKIDLVANKRYITPTRREYEEDNSSGEGPYDMPVFKNKRLKNTLEVGVAAIVLLSVIF